MRGAVGGPWRILCGLPALWVGLLYDDTALDAAWDLVKDWSAQERQALRDDVPKTALKTRFRDTTVQEIARQAIAIAHDGLKRRAFGFGGETDETRFLEELAEIAETGITHADRMLEKFAGPWNGDIDRVFAEYAY